MSTIRRCTKCRVSKPLTSFYTRKDRPCGYTSECRACLQKRARDAGGITKEERMVHHRRHNLWKAFRLTIDEYDVLFQKQGGVCAICGRPETVANQYGVMRLAVDHDHNTDKVRGLLCTKCNRGLGLFEDNVISLSKAIQYVGTMT